MNNGISCDELLFMYIVDGSRSSQARRGAQEERREGRKVRGVCYSKFIN